MKRGCLTSLLVATSLFSTAANAEVIQGTFSGVVTGASGTGGGIDLASLVGSPISGNFIYDSATMLLVPVSSGGCGPGYCSDFVSDPVTAPITMTAVISGHKFEVTGTAYSDLRVNTIDATHTTNYFRLRSQNDPGTPRPEDNACEVVIGLTRSANPAFLSNSNDSGSANFVYTRPYVNAGTGDMAFCASSGGSGVLNFSVLQASAGPGFRPLIANFNELTPGTMVTADYSSMGTFFSLVPSPTEPNSPLPPPAGPTVWSLGPVDQFGVNGNSIIVGPTTSGPFYDARVDLSEPSDYFSVVALDAETLPLRVLAYFNGAQVPLSVRSTALGMISAPPYVSGPTYLLEIGAVGGSAKFNRVVFGGTEQFDNLRFDPLPATTWRGADLQSDARASFPTVAPILTGSFLVFGAGNADEKLMQLSLVPAGTCAAGSTSCTASVRMSLTRLTSDWDPLLLLTDGSRMQGAVIFDDLGGGAGIIDSLDLGLSGQTVSNTTVLDGLGYPDIGKSVDVSLRFDLSAAGSKVSVTLLGRTASQTLTGFDRTKALGLVLLRDNDAGEQYQLNALGVTVPTTDLKSLTLSQSTVAGCKTITGKVTLSRAAPAGGFVVALGDTLTSASVPDVVTVPAGATAKSFPINTAPVISRETGSVRATLGNVTYSKSLTVRPMGVSSIGLVPASVVGTNPVAGNATLECKAGPGPVRVDLLTSNSTVAGPTVSSVVVAQGTQSASFQVRTNRVLSNKTVTISGVANGIKKSKVLAVTPAASVSPTSLKFPNQRVGTPSAALNVTLTNKGASTFSVTSVGITGTNASSFSQTNSCPSTLAAGGSCVIAVKFKPTSAGSKTAKLNVATSATATPLAVSLSGTGVLP